jgi:hypothetical protein
MKTKLMLVVFVALLACCNVPLDHVAWINAHPKPILCLKGPENIGGVSHWTLIDANGDIYITAEVYIILPDTIKSMNNSKDMK